MQRNNMPKIKTVFIPKDKGKNLKRKKQFQCVHHKMTTLKDPYNDCALTILIIIDRDGHGGLCKCIYQGLAIPWIQKIHFKLKCPELSRVLWIFKVHLSEKLHWGMINFFKRSEYDSKANDGKPYKYATVKDAKVPEVRFPKEADDLKEHSISLTIDYAFDCFFAAINVCMNDMHTHVLTFPC